MFSSHSSSSSRQLSRSETNLHRSRSAIYPSNENKDSERRQETDFLKLQLKLKFCNEYEFGRRNVFGKTEISDGAFRNGKPSYAWPAGHSHTKARDAHPHLNERFPVPDTKIFWTSLFGEEYKPIFASYLDTAEEAKRNEQMKNPCGRSIFFFHISNKDMHFTKIYFQDWAGGQGLPQKLRGQPSLRSSHHPSESDWTKTNSSIGLPNDGYHHS